MNVWLGGYEMPICENSVNPQVFSFCVLPDKDAISFRFRETNLKVQTVILI